MTAILSGIWQGTPVWVWPLFFVLLFIGVMAMRPRHSTTIPYFFYPLFGLTAANSVGSLAHVPLNWIIFGAGYAVGLFIAFRWQDTLILEKSGIQMRLKGERKTLAILMTIYFANFASGIINGVSPQLALTLGFTVIFAAIIGACAGSFTGRALRVITLGKRHAP